MKHFLPLLIAVALGLAAGCGRDAGRAKTDLLKMNYSFTVEDFIRAAKAGNERAVRLFLDAGMDANSETENGSTALLGAAENNAPSIIKLLSEKGADPGHKDKEGWTAFMKAVYGNNQQAVEELASHSKEEMNGALLLASLLGHTDMVRTLLQFGAEVDTAGDDGKTPLMYAARSGNAGLTKLLIESNADQTMTDKDGATAADLARAKGSQEVAALLTAPAATSTPALAPGVSPTLAPEEIKDLVQADQTPRPSSEEAWWKKYGLDVNQPGVVEKDGDGDHFTNAEEFLADTSPIDPASHPASASKLQWLGYHEGTLPFLLSSVQGRQAVLKAADGSEVTAREGEKAGDWKVVKVTQAEGLDKDGNSFDASKVMLEGPDGQKLRLVPGIKSHSSGSYARVKPVFADEELQLRAGEEFTLPGDPDRRYLVLDLRAEQVVIKELTGGATFTVGK